MALFIPLAGSIPVKPQCEPHRAEEYNGIRVYAVAFGDDGELIAVEYVCGASALLIIGLPLLCEWMIRRDLNNQIQGEPVHPNYRRYLRYTAQPKAISSIYTVGWWITFVPIFIGSWVYCIATYGYLLGVGLGWLPSLIVGGIAAYVWPAILVLIFAATFAITKYL